MAQCVFDRFGQKKMFKRWIPAIFHLFIYVAFLFTQIELIEIFIDGFLVNIAFLRLILEYFSHNYKHYRNSIGIGFVATFVFLARRNLLKVPRLVKPEMNGWPRIDGNLILIGELMLLIGIFCMNGADVVLQSVDPDHYYDPGIFAIQNLQDHWLLVGWERDCWYSLNDSVGGTHYYCLCIFELPAFLQALAYYSCISNTFYARLTKPGDNGQYAGNYG